VARSLCLRMLTAAPRTRAQLAAALERRGVPAAAAQTVLGRLSDVGLVDDRAFAEAWVSSRHLGRGLGRRALSAELRLRGVDDEMIAAAVGGLRPEDERATARALVDRRLSATAALAPEARLRRLVGMLMRKGYSSGLAVAVAREALAEQGQPTDEPIMDDEQD
jgi:regulatory protein